MNRKIRFLFIAFSLLNAKSSYSQLSIGLEVGYNKNDLHTNAGYRSFTKYSSLNGLSIGLPIQYSINDWLSIQADPQYIQKGYTQKRTGILEGIYYTARNSYVQLPLMSQFMFGGKKLKGFLNVGGYSGYWYGGKIEGAQLEVFSGGGDRPSKKDNIRDSFDLTDYKDNYSFNSERDRRVEFGWLLGGGISYQFNQWKLFIEGRYYQSLTDQQKAYMQFQIPRYNNTFVLQTGVLYTFKTQKN